MIKEHTLHMIVQSGKNNLKNVDIFFIIHIAACTLLCTVWQGFFKESGEYLIQMLKQKFQDSPSDQIDWHYLIYYFAKNVCSLH